ncbi:MAG: hypothetical protein ACOY4I_15390 [Bacillota bacterium]
MQESLDAISSRLTRLEERQLNVEAGIGQLTGKVSAVENKVTYILDKLQEHDMEIHRLKLAR